MANLYLLLYSIFENCNIITTKLFIALLSFHTKIIQRANFVRFFEDKKLTFEMIGGLVGQLLSKAKRRKMTINLIPLPPIM